MINTFGKYSNLVISRLVKSALRANEMSLEECCKSFNNKYLKEIEAGNVRPLNKDFLSRVTRNDFKVFSVRISRLCEFLEIEEPHVEPDRLRILSNQIGEFENRASLDTDFKFRYSAIVNFLSGLHLERMLDER